MANIQPKEKTRGSDPHALSSLYPSSPPVIPSSHTATAAMLDTMPPPTCAFIRILSFSILRTAPILSIPTISLPCYHMIAGWETVRSARKIQGRPPPREAATHGLAGSRDRGREGEQLARDTASACAGPAQSAHANVSTTGKSEEHQDEARRGKAQAYEKVVSMTCEHVVQSLSGNEGLADVIPLLLHHRLDGEGLLQVTDCPPPATPCCTRSPDSTRHRVACKYNGISCSISCALKCC